MIAHRHAIVALALAVAAGVPANAKLARQGKVLRALQDEGGFADASLSMFAASEAAFIAVGAKSSKSGWGSASKSGKSVATTTTTSTTAATSTTTSTTEACEVSCADTESLTSQIAALEAHLQAQRIEINALKQQATANAAGIDNEINALKQQATANAAGIDNNTNFPKDLNGNTVDCGVFPKCDGTFACAGADLSKIPCGSCNAQSSCRAVAGVAEPNSGVGSRSCNAKFSCSDLLGNSSVGNDSCNDLESIFGQSCFRIAKGSTIGNNSCNGQRACHAVGYNPDPNAGLGGRVAVKIGNNACQGDHSCCGIRTDVLDGQCNGPYECCNPDLCVCVV